MIRLGALLILGTALASCASGAYEANVSKAIDMFQSGLAAYQKACHRVLEHLSTKPTGKV